MHTATINAWVTSWKTNAEVKLRLFCFPYAGGAANLFCHWPARLPPGVEVCALQLPGRGSRLLEPPLTRVAELVPLLAQALAPLLDRPFAFFGHSLGAILAYETALFLKTKYDSEPIHLFASGCQAPFLLGQEPQIYNLPETAFLKELRRLNGTQDEILENKELMSLLMPVLRADFELAQTYRYTAEVMLGCAVSAYGGVSDKAVSRAGLQRWQELTTANFSLRMFAGDHFFLQRVPARFLDTFSRDLAKIVVNLSAMR